MYSDAFSCKGTIEWEKQEYQDALSDFNSAIDINPKNIVAYTNRGLLKLELGQKDSGCLDLSKAGELGYEKAYELIREYCN